VLKINFVAEVSDGHGHTGAQPLTITLVGAEGATNEAVTNQFALNVSEQESSVLNGASGDDVIFATAADDILTGYGGSDQFVFAPETNVSRDTITDFKPGEDHIDLRQFTEVDSGNIGVWLASHTAATGVDTVITLDSHDTITLKNVALASLQVSDFIVSPHH
jgi:hypothetical protein